MKEKDKRIRIGDRVTIFARGKKAIYVADFWQGGQHRRVTLQTKNKKVAIQRAVKLESELIDGKYRQTPENITLELTREHYLVYLKTEGRAPKTLVKYRGELKLFSDHCATQGVVWLSQVSPSLFDRFRAKRRKTRAAKTLYTGGVVCKQFFKWCVGRRYLLENPLQECKLRKPPTEPQPAPSLDDVKRVMAASTPRQLAMVAVLTYTGMRSGDLQRLRQEDVDLDQNWIQIVSRRGAETKGRFSRKVPIHPVLRTIIDKYPRSRGPWFFTAQPSRKYPEGRHWINPKKLNETFCRTLNKLNLPAGRKTNGFTIHSLRHFFETFCVNSGIPQRVIDTWLGHRSDRSMAAVYYRLSDAESQAFMLKVPFGDGTPAASAGPNGQGDQS